MKKIIKRTTALLFSKQTTMISSVLIIASMIVISKIFGFFRCRILAGYFSKEELDIYFASFRIPDLIFEIIITGALISTFIPIYIRYKNNKNDLSENISSIINLLTVGMFGLILVLFVFMPTIVTFITPGFSQDKIQMIIVFSRILLIGQLPFLIIGNFLTGIGQASKTFFLPSIAPVIYNIAIIFSTILLTKTFGLLAPVIGVIFGSFFFLIVQLPILYKSDFSYRFILKWTRGLVDFVLTIIPRGITIVVAQIDSTIDLSLTSMLGAGSYTVFYLAQHLQLLPVSIIGIAFGQASLPYLSELYEQKKTAEFKKIIIHSILNLLFFTIPIMSFFIFARTPLVRIFFGGQKFDWDGTVLTALTLSFFALSLPFHSIYYFITRCFYSFHNTRIPFIISVVTILINTALSLIFILVLKMPVWSLSLSFSVAMIINVVLLFLILYRMLGGLDVYFLLWESIKMMVATFFASLFSYYFMRLFDGLVLDTSRTINVFFLLTGGFGLFILLYLFIAWFIDIKEIYMVSQFVTKAREYRRKVVEIYTSYE